MANNKRGHFQQIDVFIKSFNPFAKCPHFCFERGSLVDELLRFIPQFGIGLFEASQVFFRRVRQFAIGSLYFSPHGKQVMELARLLKKLPCIKSHPPFQRVQRA